MQKLRLVLPIAITSAAAIVFGFRSHPAAIPLAPQTHALLAVPTREWLGQNVDSLLLRLAILARDLRQHDSVAARKAFTQTRFAYKRTESLLTATSPLVSGWLNGPPAEDEDDIPRPPGVTGGLQDIEGMLYPAFVVGEADSAAALVLRMHRQLAEFRMLIPELPLHPAEVLDASRLEIARVSTLGLAGFDTDASGLNVREAAESFDGMRQSIALLELETGTAEALLARATAYLRAHPDNESLNRLEFYVQYATPAAREILAVRETFPAAAHRRQRLWKLSSATVFDADAFETAAYNSFDTPVPTPQLISLGERLFFEPRLSGPGDRSCSTCHLPDKAFADARPRSPLIGSGHSFRNAPTLINAAYQPVLFYDQRASSLENQVDSVLAHPHEMASSAALAAARLKADSSMRQHFRAAFGSRPEAEITPVAVRLAVGAYLRTLTGIDSRFDRAARGDTLALSADERAGFTVYMGKGRCGTCHFLPFFNGTAPPLFKSSEGEIIGVPTRAVTRGAVLDPDSGRGGVDRMDLHLFSFKVPTLRNISRTAPYMHNGVYSTLEQVVDFYNRGGGVGIGATVPGQTLPDKPLDMTVREQRVLIAFLKALDDAP